MRRGRQEPTFEVQADYAYTAGDDAVAYFGEAGLTLIPAQRYEFDAMFARREDGSFAATTIGICRPRQNGKSFAARLYALWMADIEGMNVLYSAHLGPTVTKFFRMLCTLYTSPDRYPMFAGSLDHIYKQPGREGIYLNNGSCIEFQTRTAGSARGDSYSVIVIDEAQYLTDAQQNSILPTASSTGIDPQIIEVGTPPDSKAPGDVFKRDHDSAHAGNAGDLWWMEWSVDDLPPEDATSEQLMELAYETNPMLGYRMSERAVLNEIGRMSRDGFAIERLGWWSKSSAMSVISDAEWSACRTGSPQRDGITCYAVKFSADGTRGTLSACIRQDDGTALVIAIESRDCSFGVKWAADWLIDHWRDAAQIVIDGKAHSEDVRARLSSARVPKAVVVMPGASDVINACSMFEAAVRERTVTHTGQPGLDHSATNTCKRKVGNSGGWAFDRIGESDETAIESCALAYWQVRVTRRNPNKKMRIG